MKQVDTNNATRWLKSHSGQAGHDLRYAAVISAMGGVLIVFQAWFLARTIDAVIFHQASLATAMYWLWYLLPLFALRFLVTWAAENLASRGAIKVKQGVRQALWNKINLLGPGWLASQHSGELSSQVVDGVEGIEAYYRRFLPAISLVSSVPMIILLAVMPADWLSGLVLLFTAPLIPLFMMLIGRGAEKLNQRQWRQLARMSAHFLDVLQGMTTLKILNASKRETDLVAKVSDAFRRSTMSILRVAFLSSAVLEFFAAISIAMVAVFIGFRLLDGEMNFLYGFFVLLLAPEFYQPFRNLGAQYHARMEAIGAVEKIIDILDIPLPDSGNTEPLLQKNLPQIRLDSIRFSYAEGRGALNGIDLDIQPGQRIALVGPSGAGKSTLLKLLLGFIQPQQGVVRIGNQDLSQLDAESWRRQLAWIPQSAHIFSATVTENIIMGDRNPDPEKVAHAATLAQADDFISQLPNGYDTRIGEGGSGLSGGQMQRISLARAFYKDAPLVLLDEPTAHLDTETEQLIQQGIERLSQGRTMLIIAHRLQTVTSADLIHVLDHGRIVESGTHAELIRQDGLYQQLFSTHGDSI